MFLLRMESVWTEFFLEALSKITGAYPAFARARKLIELSPERTSPYIAS